MQNYCPKADDEMQKKYHFAHWFVFKLSKKFERLLVQGNWKGATTSSCSFCIIKHKQLCGNTANQCTVVDKGKIIKILDFELGAFSEIWDLHWLGQKVFYNFLLKEKKVLAGLKMCGETTFFQFLLNKIGHFPKSNLHSHFSVPLNKI